VEQTDAGLACRADTGFHGEIGLVNKRDAHDFENPISPVRPVMHQVAQGDGQPLRGQVRDKDEKKHAIVIA
jgi:hypothetical protein